MQDALKLWHELVKTKDLTLLDTLIDDDCVTHSPIVHSPQQGKAITKLYLTAAAHVFVSDAFRYVREVSSGRDAVLEFETEIEGVHVNGVDMIRWNAEGRIIDVKVMLRPLKAINTVHRMMGEMLQKVAGQAKGS
jgi:hypothetical protein